MRYGIGVAAVVCVAGVLAAGAQQQPRKNITLRQTVIYACVNNKTGVPRLVSSTTVCVANTETHTEWNIAGPTGAAGAKGAAGATGAQGATGPAGPAGLAGRAGPTGVQGPAGPTGPKGATGATGREGPQGLPGSVNPIPANITALSNDLGTTGYAGRTFEYDGTCVMGDTFLSTNFYTAGQALPADGRLMKISENSALFSILQTRFGGDGVTTFALPDMRPFTPKGMAYSICVFGIFPTEP
jgi:hypothetical protein